MGIGTIQMELLTIIGGGLAGSEAAFQAAERGCKVHLYEMRPDKETPAHTTGNLAELVCSNSLGSFLPDRASGLLMDELSILGSLLLKIARETIVPSGGSLSVDRDFFSRKITSILENHPRIKVIREECLIIPESPAIIASGPLTSSRLATSLSNFTKKDNLFFFDAIAPIIIQESIDFSIAFKASRFAEEKGQSADYVNCPLSKDEFDHFVYELTSAKCKPLKKYENEIADGVRTGKGKFFEACLPIEVIASRGRKALSFGPMRPIGLMDPRTGCRPYAVLQLRQENLSASLYNMVGFQTNLTFSEQNRVFRLIPGLKNAEFVRYGQMHSNTYLCAPALLLPSLQTKKRADLFIAGQLAGVEGYLGNIASGLLAGINAANFTQGMEVCIFPPSTLIGAMTRYITQCSEKSFQPMKANFGLLPELEDGSVPRPERAARYVKSASIAMKKYVESHRDILRLK